MDWNGGEDQSVSADDKIIEHSIGQKDMTSKIVQKI